MNVAELERGEGERERIELAEKLIARHGSLSPPVRERRKSRPFWRNEKEGTEIGREREKVETFFAEMGGETARLALKRSFFIQCYRCAMRTV